MLDQNTGYFALFALVSIESAGVPVPGESALVAAGVLASRGDLSIELVVVLAAVAAILGDNVGYLIGRHGGRRLLERPGFLEHHRRRVLEHGEPFFRKHGAKAVFLGRWTAGLRIAAAWLAGISHMKWQRFAFWNALGGVSWAASVGILSYLAGPTAERIFKDVGIVGGGIIVVAIVAFLVWRSGLFRRGELEDGDAEHDEAEREDDAGLEQRR